MLFLCERLWNLLLEYNSLPWVTFLIELPVSHRYHTRPIIVPQLAVRSMVSHEPVSCPWWTATWLDLMQAVKLLCAHEYSTPTYPGDTALQQLPLTPSVFSPCSGSRWRLYIERLLLMLDHMPNRKGQTGCSHPYVTNLLGGPFCCTWVEITGGRGNILPGLIFSNYCFSHRVWHQ